MYIKALISQNGSLWVAGGGYVVDYIIILYYFEKVVCSELPPKFHLFPLVQTATAPSSRL
jgi:hypothetical protein